MAPFPRHLLYRCRDTARMRSAPTWHGAATSAADDETLLAKEYDRPVFVYNYPQAR